MSVETYHVPVNWRIRNIRYGTSEGKLLGSKCEECGNMSIGERPVCPANCTNKNLKLFDLQTPSEKVDTTINRQMQWQVDNSEEMSQKAAR